MSRGVEEAVMQRKLVQVAVIVLIASAIAIAQQGRGQSRNSYPGNHVQGQYNDGIYITAEDIQTVLKSPDVGTDNTIRVLDVGPYQVSVAVEQRNAPRPPAPAPPGGRGAGPAAPAAAAPAAPPGVPCGEAKPGVDGPRGFYHDDTLETYQVISGEATVFTGGVLVNGTYAGPDEHVTQVLNGPTCFGTMVGYTSRFIKVGDIVVIPEGVPHGFDTIKDHITYTSFRPDLKKVLRRGYVNPALRDKYLK